MNIRCNSPTHSSPSTYPENWALETTSALTNTSRAARGTPSRPEFIDDPNRMQSTPIAVARVTKSSMSATNGTTTVLMPVSRITAGSTLIAV
ncbi:hypothetical protein BFJ63_vAg16816 [Fusarium oxysporum f. sp. narcissi]|uniref:Uncharacterized protein n=1 Tax=Fusarium oxysporum f. sp. narcissi TaxID=451672 RepID=A0A4V1RY43_FUSOX|nr:hypothetical protein BFJ63_vAg16816 [Fusarium oxysporum f. sp. narcissi]